MAIQLRDSESQPYLGMDRAVVDFVHLGLSYPPNEKAKPLMCVFATPERAFAQVWKRLGLAEEEMLSKQKMTPLPFASIDRQEPVFDPTRDSPAMVRRIVTLYDEKTGEEKYYQMPWPVPVILTYQVTLWVRQIRDADDLALQIRMLMTRPGQGTYLEVEFPFPMDKKLVWTRIGEVRKLPFIDAPDRQRTLRTVVELVCESWLTKFPQEYTRVETLTTEVVQSLDMVTPGTVLSSMDATAAGITNNV